MRCAYFAPNAPARGLQLMLVRLKPRALAALQRAADNSLRPEMLHELSVDECVQSLASSTSTPVSG